MHSVKDSDMTEALSMHAHMDLYIYIYIYTHTHILFIEMDEYILSGIVRQ